MFHSLNSFKDLNQKYVKTSKERLFTDAENKFNMTWSVQQRPRERKWRQEACKREC
jgi:hypothetical protein